MSETTAAADKKPLASLGNTQVVSMVNQNQPANNNDNPDDNLTDDEKANIEKGLNKDGSPKDGGAGGAALTDEQKKKNLDAGLNEDGSPKTTELTQQQKDANVAAGLNEDGSPKAPVMDDAAVLAYLKSKNIAVDSLAEIGKVTPQLSDEDKKKIEDALDKKRLDWFVAHGGTVDSYAAMKVMATTDLTLMSEQELEKELKDAGFSEEEKKMIRAERYYQLDDEAIESLTDEKEKELAKKKREFGTKKLQGKATHKQQLAVSFFTNIDKALAEEAAEAADEVEFTQKVDSHFQTVQNKITLQMGKTAENVDIAPLEIDVPTDVITEVKNLLRDTEQRNKILYTEEGNLNIAFLSDLLVRNKVLEAAANKSYLKGVSDNTAEFEKTFPIRDANGIGLGTLQNGSGKHKTVPKIAGMGKAKPVAQMN